MNSLSGKNENSRIEAFSDGVFAIAITLLILEIKVPPLSSVHSTQDLWNGLIKLWPSYLAFSLSFCVLLISWINHHYLFNLLEGSSRPFLYANGFLLLTITFMPFPAALLAQYGHRFLLFRGIHQFNRLEFTPAHYPYTETLAEQTGKFRSDKRD